MEDMFVPLISDMIPYVKKGDLIRVFKKPEMWSDYLNDYDPLDIANYFFPFTLTVMNIAYVPIDTPHRTKTGSFYSRTHHAISCKFYGWNLESIIEAGAEIYFNNTNKEEIKRLNFPFRIHKRNNQYYIKN